MRNLRLLVLSVLALLAAGALSAAAADGRESWRRLDVLVLSEDGGRPLAGARVRIEALGAPIWETPLERATDARGRATAWIPRWGGPVEVTAAADEHLPSSREAGPGGGLEFELPRLQRRHRLQLGLQDENGASLSPLRLPEHAQLVVRSYGSAPRRTRFCSWIFPAREAFARGVELPAGGSEIALRVPALTPTWLRVRMPETSGIAVPYPERAPVPLTLEVFDVATDEPLPDAIVRYRGWGEGSARTDHAGRLVIHFLSGDALPDTLELDWSRPGWVRDRWYTAANDPDTPGLWRLGMHEAGLALLVVGDAAGKGVPSGIVWSIGGPWPTQRWEIRNGSVQVSLPPAGTEGDLRLAFAAPGGFALLDPLRARAAGAISLLPWRRVRGVVDRAGEPCPGSCQVGVHLLDEVQSGIQPASLSPWVWTADIGVDGTIDAAVPESPGAVLQVDVGRRTGFFRASDLWSVSGAVLRLAPESALALRTLLLLGPAGEVLADTEVRLRWRAPVGQPQPLDLFYAGRTDDEGLFRHDGPVGPYDVFVLPATGVKRIAEPLNYPSGEVGVVRVPAGE